MTVKSENALSYHSKDPKGKIETTLTKSLETQEELSLAYSPGVAEPCLEIHKNPSDAYEYTGKGNLVGVISDGSAVLGLGNIGPDASKPVMEGKAMLFKKFADIDVFDIEVNAESPDHFIQVVKSLEPTFGGINLEDIKAPECFYIEEELRKVMKIPVFHDDQHGTAIISAAAFINALEVSNRSIDNCKVVFSGAGAAAIACAQLFLDLGVKREHLTLCDSRGVIYQGRKDGMNPYKERFARDTGLRTLADAIKGADAFVGVSAKGVLTEAMVKDMAPSPIIFALANPDPEILPSEARRARSDAIIATGRSDFPNQVNNVLGFPFIFRGALDTRATHINEAMKKAAVFAIAGLAKENVPDEVMKVYSRVDPYIFGRDYLIPKPVDPRVLLHVAPAVAKAAMESGVAQRQVDLDDYYHHMEKILGPAKDIIRKIRIGLSEVTKKRQAKPTIILPHGHDPRMIRAANQIHSDNEIDLCLLGSRSQITRVATELGISNFENKVTIINPLKDDRAETFANQLFEIRSRKGLSRSAATEYMRKGNYFAAMILKQGEVDGMVTGLVEPYKDALKPILEVIGTEQGQHLAGIKILIFRNKLYFFSDCTINIDPTPEEIAEIAITSAKAARYFTDDEIKVALLSFSSFGSNRHPKADKIGKAARILEERGVNFVFDGEIQADVATNEELQQEEFPFCKLQGPANVLIFPDLASSNIAYKLLSSIGGATALGPILIGPQKATSILERGASIEDMIHSIYITAGQGFRKEILKKLK